MCLYLYVQSVEKKLTNIHNFASRHDVSNCHVSLIFGGDIGVCHIQTLMCLCILALHTHVVPVCQPCKLNRYDTLLQSSPPCFSFLVGHYWVVFLVNFFVSGQIC